MKLLPGKFTFGDMCVFVQVCMRKRERRTTQVLWEGRPYVLWDSQKHPRVRTHLLGPLTSLASSFPLWVPEALDCPQGPQISFILSLNTLQKLPSWKANPAPPFITCVTSARPLLSAPQFPHTSHELIRLPAVWGCCRIKAIITWKCLEQSVNIKVGAFFPLLSLPEKWTLNCSWAEELQVHTSSHSLS